MIFPEGKHRRLIQLLMFVAAGTMMPSPTTKEFIWLLLKSIHKSVGVCRKGFISDKGEHCTRNHSRGPLGMESDLSSVPVSSGLKPGLLAQEVHTLSSRWEDEAPTGLQLTTLRCSSPHLFCGSCIGAAALMCAYLLSQMQTYAKTRFCPPARASLLQNSQQ